MTGPVLATADRLRIAALALRDADRALAFAAEVFGRPHVSVAPCAADVEMVAAWLDEHPDIDALMVGVLEPEQTRR
jgi:D-serine deaminase-like pyridoxal phosphate-dependent protein